MTVGMGVGQCPAKVLIVGDVWSAEDNRTFTPFNGSAGLELERLLHEAKILRSECYTTNAVNAYPPSGDLSNWIAKAKKDVTSSHVLFHDKYVRQIVLDGYRNLLKEITLVDPNIIITLGDLPLWALTGAWGALKWRGSHLTFTHPDTGKVYKLIPTLHPAKLFGMWDMRSTVVLDLKRAQLHSGTEPFNPPAWNFTIRPSFGKVVDILLELYHNTAKSPTPYRLSLDIETRAGHIACVGIAWSRLDAICIPLMCMENKQGFWGLEEETEIVFLLYKLLTHPNAKIVWQNGLYDAQYIYRHWHFIPTESYSQDTMISQHSCFAALPKGLDFISSMYAQWYVYWKDEGKTWSNTIGEDQLWSYNCQDCVYTYEDSEALEGICTSLNLTQVDAYQQGMFAPVLRAMLRGIRVIPQAKARMAQEIQDAIEGREKFLEDILGFYININSPKQMCALFYEDFGIKPIMKRKRVGNSVIASQTADDEALQKIANMDPLLKPVCNAIADLRTLGKFLKDFVLMPLDVDGRMRCSFNIAGDAAGKSAPYSYRLSSSENAFGSGGNLQTIPSEKSKSSGKAAARGSLDFKLPNIRTMYGPDLGFTVFDMDLDRADLQVVVWESDDPMLKAAMKAGADIHLLNVFSLDGQDPPPLEELVESHPKYLDHRIPRKHKREFAKVFCHATNYLGKARTVAGHTGRSVHEIERAQKQWFGAHPGILAWHERVINQAKRFRFVENKFGYRWYIFDRIDEQLFPKCVAWIPQSTVGNVINSAWRNIYKNLPHVQVLLQVHDSLVGQFPTHLKQTAVQQLKEQSSIIIPYEDPLIIPVGVKTSEISWGDCE